MSTETEQLVVQLEARITDFEKNFRKASKTANDSYSAIENRGRQAGARLQADMAKATAGIGNSLRSVSASLASSFGVAGVASATGFLAIAIKINSELAKISSLARDAALSTDRLQQVKFAANMGGVSDDTFASDIRTSLGLLDEAQRQTNSLKRLFNANGLAIKQANGELITFDQLLSSAAKLMAGTSTEAQKAKIAEMLGLSREWIGALKDGPEAFERMAKEANNAGAVIDAGTIKKAKEFDKAWDQALVRFKAGFTETLTDLGDAFADFWSDIADSVPGVSFFKSVLDKWAGGLSGMTLPELQEALQRSIEQGVGKVEIARLQDEIDRRLGKVRPKITVTANTNVTPTVIPKEDEKDKFSRAVDAANKRIAATNAETASIGLNSEARERARLVAELEESAKQANTAAGFQNAQVTDAQRQKIEQLADAMEAAARKQREAQQSFASYNELLQFSGNIAVDFVDRLGDKTAKLSDLIASALSSLKKAALQALFLGQGPLGGIFGTASTVSGGTGGIFGAIGTALGGARAEGGPVSAKTPYLVGERGPEIMVPRTSGTIIPNHKLGGGSSTTVAQTNTFHIEVAAGGAPEHNDDLVRKMSKALEQHADAMVAGSIRRQLRPGGLLSRY